MVLDTLKNRLFALYLRYQDYKIIFALIWSKIPGNSKR